MFLFHASVAVLKISTHKHAWIEFNRKTIERLDSDCRIQSSDNRRKIKSNNSIASIVNLMDLRMYSIEANRIHSWTIEVNRIQLNSKKVKIRLPFDCRMQSKNNRNDWHLIVISWFDWESKFDWVPIHDYCSQLWSPVLIKQKKLVK